MSESHKISYNPEKEYNPIIKELIDRTDLIEKENRGDHYYESRKLVRSTELRALFAAMDNGLNREEVIRRLAIEEAAENKEAHLDPLMGIDTRNVGFQRMNEALAVADREGSHVTVAMLDLDHFKEINDTLGHDNGDAVLQQTAGHIKNSVRAGDIVFRFGGEEIMVVFQKTDEKTAGEVIDRVRETMPETVGEAVKSMGFNLGNRRITMSAGIAQARHVASDGISYWRQDHEAMRDHMVKSADKHMYQAKHEGRNRVYDSQGDVTMRLASRQEEMVA